MCIDVGPLIAVSLFATIGLFVCVFAIPDLVTAIDRLLNSE